MLHGQCSTLERWALGGKPLNEFADGTPCQQLGASVGPKEASHCITLRQDGHYGSCDRGICKAHKEEQAQKLTGALRVW